MNSIKKTNIEILRILAMIMIIAHHYCIYGVFDYWNSCSSFTEYLNNVIVGILSVTGKLGVDIFVLITGYFMIVSNYKVTKVIRLYFITLTYSILFLIISLIYNEHYVSLKILYSSLFPIGENSYWFITTYLMLYLFIPILNNFILSSKKSMLNFIIIITTFLWVIIPTFTCANYGFSNLMWFFYLYFVGASIRLKSYAEIFSNKKLFTILSFISCVVIVGYAFIKCIGNGFSFFNLMNFAQMQTVFILSIAVSIFHYFKDLKINYNSHVNQIAASVLGVYLFHDNIIVRPFLWRVIVQPCNVMDKPYMILYLFGIVVGVLILGVIIDKFLMFLLGKFIRRLVVRLKFLNKIFS